MRQKLILAFALLATIFSACNKQEMSLVGDDGSITFHAISGDAPETKTVLQSGTLVRWCPQDEIHVFYGNTSGRFVSTNTSVAASADFRGELPGLKRNDSDAFWAVYPYAQDQSFDGNSVTLSLPASQTAVEGTFADDLFLSIARSSNTDLHFYNVCGGLKFSVAIDGVKKVIFCGKNNEPLAGKVKVGFDNANLPKVTEVLDAETILTITAPNGGTFTPGSWYYLVSLPATLSQGYVMELYGDSLIDTKEGDSYVEIIRSVWGVLKDVGGGSSVDDFAGLCIEAIEDGEITISNPHVLTLEYSKDAKSWTVSNENPIILSMDSGDIVCFRGNNETYGNWASGTNFQFSSDCYVYGNIMSLIDKDEYETLRELTQYGNFAHLFENNEHVLNHPTKPIVLPATTLTSCCYWRMFSGCSRLTTAPVLPATTLVDGCYWFMFEGCSNLTSAPELPSISLYPACYEGMFYGCYSLTSTPELPATTLAQNCYAYMFFGCTGLTVPPELPATLLGDGCYSGMFSGCTNLTTPPALPATSLAESCYHDMFSNCTSLTSAPELPAKALKDGCYSEMFQGCSNLNYIKALFTTTPGPNYTLNWVEGVAVSGTFVKNPDATWDVVGVNGVPEGWIVDDGAEEFTGLSIEAIEDGMITISNPLGLTIEFSKDARTWTASNSNPIEIGYSGGDIVRLRGDNQRYSTGSDNATNIQCSSDCYLYGNIMSLISSHGYDSAIELVTFNTFNSLFEGNNHIINHPNINILLPATALTWGCYCRMFKGCSKLTSAPELPATTLAGICYYQMFADCASLTVTPELPATVLAESCYYEMFYGCSNLTTANNLPATTLASGCYASMFYGCTELAVAPELPATQLVSYCYALMFHDCSKLKYIKALFLTTPGPDYTAGWVENVASTGTFVKNPEATWDIVGMNGVPEGWTVEGGSVPDFTGLCIEGIEAGTITIANPLGLTIEYSKDASIWTSANANPIKIDYSTGDIVRLRGNNEAYSDGSNHTVFIFSSDCYVYGNVMSLVHSSGYDTATTLTRPYTFKGLFYDKNNNTHLFNHPSVDIVLPASTLTEACYESMFDRCIKLTRAPELPATRIKSRSYASMFAVCSDLVTAPNLPATVLDEDCYYGMFAYCLNLINAPELPATTMAKECYRTMFFHCNSLTVAPELPATTLANNCYYNMFGECTSLIKAPQPLTYLLDAIVKCFIIVTI